MKELEKILEQWEKATGRDPRSNSMRMGSCGDYMLQNAKSLMKDDPSGLLASLALRSAFKKMIEENKMTIKQALSDEWKALINDFRELERLLFEDWAGDIFKTFAGLISKVSIILGKEITSESLNNSENIEKVITDTFKDFNSHYKIAHERFNEGIMKKFEPRIIPSLYVYRSLEKYVNSLRDTNYDNFISIAYIDDESDEYNKYFAFGVKNNGVVVVVSDRDIFSSPNGRSSRRPERQLEEKLNYSWFPYDKLYGNEDIGETNALISYENNQRALHEILEDDSYIWISVMLYLISKKYFVDLDPVDKRIFFNSEIKLIEGASTALVVGSELHLPTISHNVSTFTDLDKIKDTGRIEICPKVSAYHQFYIDQFPIPEELSRDIALNKNFTGTKEQAEVNLWWEMRKRQADYINSKLEYSQKREQEIMEWFSSKILERQDFILDYIFKNHGLDDNPYSKYGHEKKDPVQIITNHEPYPYLLIQCYEKEYLGANYDYYLRRESKLIKGWYYKFNTWSIEFHSTSKSLNKMVFSANFNTYTDLENILGISWREFPVEIQRFTRVNNGEAKPYGGNSILGLTDPIDTIKNKYNSMRFRIRVLLTKTEFKALAKEKGYVLRLSNSKEKWL